MKLTQNTGEKKSFRIKQILTQDVHTRDAIGVWLKLISCMILFPKRKSSPCLSVFRTISSCSLLLILSKKITFLHGTNAKTDCNVATISLTPVLHLELIQLKRTCFFWLQLLSTIIAHHKYSLYFLWEEI